MCNLLQHDDLVRVSHPGAAENSVIIQSGKLGNNSLEDPARVRRAVGQVVVNPSRQHFLGETHHVRLDTEMFVAPHLAGSSTSGLDLVHHEGDVVLLADGRQATEEGWGGLDTVVSRW